jgi:hypothetical protein
MVIGVVPPGGGEPGGPAGYSYRVVVVRAGREAVLRRAAALGFSGWVGPEEDGSVVLVPAGERASIASAGRDLEALGADLAADVDGTPATVLAADVVQDRLLELLVWPAGAPLLRYRSDPSVLDEEEPDEPAGVHHAEAIARAFGVEGEAARLREELAERLDPDEHIESERLDHVLSLLGLPVWVVSAWRLPKYVPYGPDRSAFVRLHAGATGGAGATRGLAVGLGRRVRDTVRRRGPGPRRDVPTEGGDDGGWLSPDDELPPW